MGLCPKSGFATFASDGLPGFHESYSPNVLRVKNTPFCVKIDCEITFQRQILGHIWINFGPILDQNWPIYYAISRGKSQKCNSRSGGKYGNAASLGRKFVNGAKIIFTSLHQIYPLGYYVNEPLENCS